MTKINSVLGPVDIKDLGYTLMHEHVLCANWTARMAYPDWIDREEFMDLALRMVRRAQKFGVKTIVDATPPALGRDINILRELSERAEIHIIAATGFYWYEETWLVGKDIDRMTERLVNEAEQGIQGTDSKAGFIKCATDMLGITENNRKLLQIAANTQKATGLPIYTHATVKNKIGLDQQRFFIEEGIDPGKLAIGHCGDTDDVGFIESIIEKGSYVGLDRFGLDWIFPDEKRIETLLALVERGHADRLFLSHDFSVFIDEFNNEWEERKRVDLDSLSFQYSHLSERVLPQLKAKGMTQAQIEQMLYQNPQNFFGEEKNH